MVPVFSWSDISKAIGSNFKEMEVLDTVLDLCPYLTLVYFLATKTRV